MPGNLLQWPVKGVVFLSSLGYVGVFLFFVISGFCIHLQWAKSRVAGKPSSIRFGPFWKRRIRRLYPPYLIALALFLAMAALSVGLDVTHFFVYDVVMHLLMLHNLDPRTCYSINGVFWTLAIEEQLYLAYFLLLYLRTRWGWIPTLVICGLARVAWFFFGHGLWLATGFGIPVPEAAAFPLAHLGLWRSRGGSSGGTGSIAKMVSQPVDWGVSNSARVRDFPSPAHVAERHTAT